MRDQVQKSRVSSSLLASPILRFAGTALLHEHDVVSGISVIIATQAGPYGVLGVHTRQHRTFTRDEINFLQAVANVLGSAIERYQTEAQLRRLNRTNRALSRWFERR